MEGGVLTCLFNAMYMDATGLAPLMTMLNACAPGVAVVNIDVGTGLDGNILMYIQFGMCRWIDDKQPIDRHDRTGWAPRPWRSRYCGAGCGSPDMILKLKATTLR